LLRNKTLSKNGVVRGGIMDRQDRMWLRRMVIDSELNLVTMNLNERKTVNRQEGQEYENVRNKLEENAM
jgi:hypothetical protein